MALQFIVLEKLPSDPGSLAFRFCIWADVPAARQAKQATVATPTAFLDATPAEKLAITNGLVAETVETLQFAAGTSLVAMANDLKATALAFQAKVNGSNPWNRYGTRGTFDGTTWTVTNGGVA